MPVTKRKMTGWVRRVEVCPMIIVTAVEGAGIEGDPAREVRYFYHADPTDHTRPDHSRDLIVRIDPCDKSTEEE